MGRGFAPAASARRARAPRGELVRGGGDEHRQRKKPEHDDDSPLPRAGDRDPSKPAQQAARIAALVEAEPLPNEAYDRFPRRKLGRRIERTERFDDPSELADPQSARIASRLLVMLDQLDELGERTGREVLGSGVDQGFAPDFAVELGREVRADVGEPGDAAAAGRLRWSLRGTQTPRAARGRREQIIGRRGAARRREQPGGRENDEPLRHASAAARRAAISVPSRRSLASAWIAMSSA